MTPKTIEQLNSIGWSMVRRSYPVAANRLIEAVCERRVKSHRTAAASRKQAKVLQSVEQSIAALMSKLEAIPEDLSEDIRWGGARDESERYDGPPDRLAKAVDALRELSPGSSYTLSLLNSLGTRTYEGHLPNKPSYDIAQALFDVFLLGTGERPGYGTLADESGDPSGAFGKLLKDLLAEAGISVSKPQAIAETLIKPFKEDPIALQSRLRSLQIEQRDFELRVKRSGYSLFDPIGVPDFPSTE